MDRSFSSVTNFINYLKSHGYPEDSFVTEFLINNKYSADLAIIEPKTKEIIALIEFKKRRNIKTEELAIKQLTNIYRAVNDRTVQIYLVYSDDETQLFDVYVFQEKNGSFYLSPTGISNYLITKNTKLSKELINNKKNQKKTNNIY